MANDRLNFLPVVNQYYEAEVVSEYVIRGNTAVLKCNIPSFVVDFVRVEAWTGSDGSEYTFNSNYGTSFMSRESFRAFIHSKIPLIPSFSGCSVLRITTRKLMFIFHSNRTMNYIL